MSSWGRVFRSLRDRMPPGSYHLGKSLLRVEQDASSVSAIFADGTHERGDLLIGADGGRSTVRELFLPGQQPDYAGYVAWRAMLDERDVPPAIHEELFVNFTYCLPPGELFLAYPVPGRNNETQPGQRGLQHRLVPANHASTARRFLHRCEREAARHVDPAAPAATRDHRMDQDAGPRAGGSSGRGDFRARPAAVFQAILDFTSPQIVFGRVALLGDAAFLARPHPGAGTTKCAMDAECLADSIASLGIDGGLAKYQRLQGAFGAGLVRQSQHDGSYLTDQHKPREQRRNKDVSWGVDDLMRDHDGRSVQVQRILDESRRA